MADDKPKIVRISSRRSKPPSDVRVAMLSPYERALRKQKEKHMRDGLLKLWATERKGRTDK